MMLNEGLSSWKYLIKELYVYTYIYRNIYLYIYVCMYIVQVNA